ncbi:MAG TPA: aspartate/glutamate racemase family protein, partial [Pseudolabrys sp.]|nr:aspartate/glutamate racemase family protein [Pseudolabrys sp.]
MRIWYQSYVDYEHGKIYWDRLRAHLKDIVDEGTEVDVKGITPHDSYAHPIVEMRCAREVICNAVRAEREGYDAFVVGHFQDAGLYEARSVVNIPVVALGEASMFYSCQLGQRAGIVTINTRYIPWFHHQIRKYGLERRITGVHAMQFEPGQILKAYESQALADKVQELFAEQAKPLVAGGCEVLI